MDRTIVYPGAIPLDTDILQGQRDAMIALGFLARATLGVSTVVDGLAIAQSTVADMQVHVGPGSIVSLATVDSAAFGSLTSNAAPLVKMGINTLETVLTLTAPVTAGQSINYLIQATLAETDASPVVLPYYNASNPAVPYSGPANSGAAQNTRRTQTVTVGLKAGTPATTGTQTTPAVDAGYVGLYVVTVAYGQTTITTANLSGARIAAAPFIGFKLPDLRPGFSAIQRLTGSSNYTVPNGVTKLRVRMVGGGGGGGGGNGTGAGGGGGGGGYAEEILTVTPGQVIAYVVGAAGPGGNSSGTNGTSGGDTTFGGLTAGGGLFGSGGAGAAGASGAGGTSSGGTINAGGQAGNAGSNGGGNYFGGFGGSSQLGGGGAASSGIPSPGTNYGGGGAGGASAQAGATGAAGTIVVEY